MNNLENLRERVLALSVVDRTALAEAILASFDPGVCEAVEQAWVVEALDRIAAFNGDEMETYSVEEVQKRIGLS